MFHNIPLHALPDFPVDVQFLSDPLDDNRRSNQFPYGIFP